ncbi:MAG: HEPN domain-containing protein [Bacteroidota bacterium]
MIELSQILSHLPNDKIEELETVTQRVLDTQKAEMIILFGSYARGTYSEKDGKIRRRKSDYDVLVVVRQRITVREIKDLLEDKFDDISRIVNLEIHPINFINSNIEDAHYFFLDIKREGKILYDNQRFELSDPVEPTPAKRREIAEKDFRQWFSDSKEFYELSKNSKGRKKYGLAAFNLQQCCELCYSCVEMVFKHYRTREHRLTVLRRKMRKFDDRIDVAFPLETKTQKGLFEHLDYAYIGGRYRSEEDYSVTLEQLAYWSKEAKKLMKFTEVICQERIACLKEIEREKTDARSEVD